MDSQITSGNIDEAQEKLFGDSNSSGGQKVEIKYFTDPKNGDTKIDISEVRQVFVGMGKEELMKFANDPFWVRMRWFLFILFWALWFGMLAGAVGIILLAPKCAAPSPSKWYEDSPIYHLNVKNFMDASGDGIGDLSGLESKLDYFQDLGVDAILLDPIMKTAEGTDDVVDFMSVHPDLGTLSDLKKLMKSAKEKGLNLLMKIIPNYSSNQHEWFNKSISGEEPYKDYYIWTDPNVDEGGKPVPKNNWLSVSDSSAWTYNDVRKQFYLHQFNSTQPDLNFRNPEVVKYFSEVYKFWLDQGFSGLYLDKIEYLVEDDQFRDESSSSQDVGKVHDEYDFQNHGYTSNLQESWDILSNWSSVFRNYSKILAVSRVPELKEADIIWRPIDINKSTKLTDLKAILNRRLNKLSPGWSLTCDDCSERIRIGLQAVLLMLPGSALLPSGTELGLTYSSIFQWDPKSENFGFTKGKPWKPLEIGLESRNVVAERNNTNSYLSMFERIIKERRSPSVLHGATAIFNSSSVVAFTRRKKGSPNYLAAFNVGDKEATVNLQEFLKTTPSKLSLIASHTEDNFKDDLSSLDVTFPAGSFAIYQFVPSEE